MQIHGSSELSAHERLQVFGEWWDFGIQLAHGAWLLTCFRLFFFSKGRRYIFEGAISFGRQARTPSIMTLFGDCVRSNWAGQYTDQISIIIAKQWQFVLRTVDFRSLTPTERDRDA